MMPVANGATFDPITAATSMRSGTIMGTEDEGTRPSVSNIDIGRMGKDDFMKLLLAQMQHQDPMNPTDNTEFVAQLAQFSSLEQMTTMNDNLQASIAQNSVVAESVNNAMMVNYFGKTVSAKSELFDFDGAETATLQFELASDMVTGSLEIYTPDGTLVREIVLDPMEEGLNEVEWNGVNNFGNKALSGSYMYLVKGTDILNEPIDYSPRFTGVVEGITYQEGKAHLKVGNILLPYDKVQQISDESE